MFKKVHIRLTLLCAGITTLIMTVVSFIFLSVSEHELYQNQLLAFQNDINTITTNLEHQSVISMEWLSKMEAQGNYRFIITDNGVPFLYNKLNDKETNSGFNNTDYLEITIRPGDMSSSLEINVFYSLEALKKQITEQRLRFVFIGAVAVFILTVFSWFFTGKLLHPIMENQQKQTEFIASASHELRTPLAVILSATECCKTASPDNREGFLKTIHDETLRMSTLVNDMLTLSSSDNNRFTVKIQSIELDTLLINIYDAFKPIAEDKAMELTINLPEKVLPPCSADPDRISQVISILIHNAISYTPEQGKVEISLSHSKEHFYISVKDNGIGISDEDKKKIFDRFYRAEKSRSTKEHFGLGLSIAYEIVTAHGGSISVTDAEGGGSVFTVRL
ncbi:MAG: HAMP domain-containing histidine kinase [Lachnospiraceae bacterium]|nr:HAMP domain-containing histidine kinase [Lachnospiraceae bacterium]